MSGSGTHAASLPSRPVLGKFRYIAAGHTPVPSPHNFHLPALSEFADERVLPLHDMRPVPTVEDLPKSASHPQLSTHGFTAVTHASVLHLPPHTLASWKDSAVLTAQYIPETAAMLQAVTGCRIVVAESLLLRSAKWTESDALATHASSGHGARQSTDGNGDAEQYPGLTAMQPVMASETKMLEDMDSTFPQIIGFDPVAGGASPAPKIHLDYAPAGARVHIREYHPALAAAAGEVITVEDGLLAEGKSLREEYTNKGPRWALYSVWRPLKEVKRDPLALGDQRTFREGDYVPVVVKTPCLGRKGGEWENKTHDAESYLARYSEGQEWYWIERQKPEEVLIIGLFDSAREKDGRPASGGTLHSSVHLEGTENEPPRESLELRCLCIW